MSFLPSILTGMFQNNDPIDYGGVASDMWDDFSQSDPVNDFINMTYQGRYGVNSEEKDRLIQSGQIPGAPEKYASGSESDRYLGDRVGAGYLSGNHWGSTLPYIVGSGLRETGQGIGNMMQGGSFMNNIMNDVPMPREDSGGFDWNTFETGLNAARQGAQDQPDRFGMPGMGSLASIFGF